MGKDRILGIRYDNVTMGDALKRVEGFARGEENHIIIHLSLPLLMAARQNKNLRILLEEADLVIPSGRYIYWAARLLKRPLRESIDPSLFVKMLLTQSVELNKTVYLFGGKGTTIEKACYNLKREIPQLFVIGKHRGNYQKRDHEDIVKAIGKASPDYFFIGLGSPAEELWFERTKRYINAKIVIFVEGLFELFAGNLKRYNRYNKNLETRFIKREIPHPRALRKMWMIPSFVFAVYGEKLFWKH